MCDIRVERERGARRVNVADEDAIVHSTVRARLARSACRLYGSRIVKQCWIPLLALVVFVSGCGGKHQERVTVVGDSLTVLATPKIRSALHGVRLSIYAHNGNRADQLVDGLRADLPADVVIVNVGTNDAIQARTHPDWLTGFNEIVSLVEHVPCAVFVTISTLVDSIGHGSVAAQIDAKIQNLAQTDSNVRVIDWNAAAHGPDGKNYVNLDGIHETPEAGSQWFADQYAAAVASCNNSPAHAAVSVRHSKDGERSPSAPVTRSAMRSSR